MFKSAYLRTFMRYVMVRIPPSPPFSIIPESLNIPIDHDTSYRYHEAGLKDVLHLFYKSGSIRGISQIAHSVARVHPCEH